MLKKLMISAALLIGIYFIYAWITGALLFQLTVPAPEDITEERNIDRFYGEEASIERIGLLEGRQESKAYRNRMKAEAEETLDVTMFKVTDGFASEIFYSSLVEAADRDVEVRLLLDGLFHNLRGEEAGIIHAFAAHPSIELRFYEPLDLVRPWTWNNRLHDKLIISDNNLAMITGRNIGDRYFAPADYEGATNDRDAVLFVPENRDPAGTALEEMQTYFDLVWNHDFSQPASDNLTIEDEEAGERKLAELRDTYASYTATHEHLFLEELSWEENTHTVQEASFIHNPVERMNKEPWVWEDLTNLIAGAESSVYMQSPFVIPSDNMRQHWGTAENIEITLLTNSLAATPNLPTYSRYGGSYREELAASSINLYEYQGPEQSIHGKSYVIDDRISAVGSFNLDPRSAYISTESMLIIDSEEVAAALTQQLDALIDEESLEVKEDGSYEESEQVEEAEVPFSKAAGRRLWAAVTYFFEHLF
ncbi:phospholipase D-like domain-containing protein [Alkalicoccus daliensis]|uniref:Phosphatidylserine/phosphatidylglycerophosphate/cardiolipin synthase n=1 Tax=Alkalicoccus daliensis TaxID=745820 RepID=A0A1H0FXE8_9BACI|nr:phospholipase D-like domain-containing protein [Alkalicoccus daliensis]SDN99241.1 Phosphatidylserine/phosphatidylglycerophosphate/cardiolipin synthase [Alkalicoccus daliensis]